MLELKNVRKTFGGLTAVDGVSLTVPEGQIIGLIGPNGSGKSTLVNVISGILPPDGGAVHFEKRDITGWEPEQIFQLGLGRGFQNPSVFTRMSVLDNTLLPVKSQRGENPFWAPLRRLWQHQERENVQNAHTILNQIEMDHQFDKWSSDLSGGQMKLLELSRTLMGEPRMLLLDEPTAGVAPKLAYDIFEQIAQMRDTFGVTYLIIEHRLEILFNFVDWVYVMHMGEIIAQGKPNDIAKDETVKEVYFGD